MEGFIVGCLNILTQLRGDRRSSVGCSTAQGGAVQLRGYDAAQGCFAAQGVLRSSGGAAQLRGCGAAQWGCGAPRGDATQL
jgi:hypothetical protein